MSDLTCEGCDVIRGGFNADEFIVGGLCPSCRDEGRARDIKAERNRYREALERIAAKVPSDGQGGELVVAVSAARACEIAAEALGKRRKGARA